MAGFEFVLAVLSSVTLELSSLTYYFQLWRSLYVPEADSTS